MVSRASESLPSPSTVVSSRSGRVRSSVTPQACGATGPAARRDARGGSDSGGGAGQRGADEPFGQPAAVGRRTVGAQQPAGEVHAVDDEVDLGGEVLAGAGEELV